MFFLKKYILIFLLLLSTPFVFAQKQANIWYFGRGVGLDFNQNPAVPISNSGLANSFEGLSCISDNNGKILFYSNGLTVVNKIHQVMKNGMGLNGDRSSTNNTVIVPLPGADSIYYLFTTGAALQETHGFKYNIIDMSGDGGLGEVLTKNILIEDTIFEKIAAVRHCNNKDVWVVIHKWGTDEYHSYLVTRAGLNPVPVISHAGLVISGYENNEIGTLKFSAKGNKFVSVHSFENDLVELMDFDNTTGIISNPVSFKPNASPIPPSFPGVYGAEFSPDAQLLYISANNNSTTQASVLYQFDIASNISATILASKQIISVDTSWYGGALQMGPDLKIYMAMWNDTSVSVIENPDVYGPGCNFRYNKIYMGPVNSQPVQFGLPTFIQSYFDTSSNPYDFSRSGNCTDLNVTFKINRLSGIDSVKWDFGDIQQSQVLQPVHTYAAPGFYYVRLIVYKVDCSGLNDTITRKIWIAGSDNFLGADTSSCNALALEIGVDEIFGVNYLWNTGFTGNKITTTGFGDYWLEMEQNGCKVRDTISVSSRPKPEVSLGADTTICKYKSVVLKSEVLNYDTYLWNTGETTSSILADRAGIYYVTVTKNSCEASDTIQVLTGGDCDVYIPSAFTPNKDNLNETFGVIDNVSVQYFSMQIYSKWGQLVFNSNDITKKWDGTFKGKNMPDGAYLWILNYVNSRGKKIYDQGTVLLIR